MANRYAIATAAYSLTSTWSTTFNGAGGASVPVAGDNAIANGFFPAIDGVVAASKFTAHGASYSGYDGGGFTVDISGAGAKSMTGDLEAYGAPGVTVTGSTGTFVYTGAVTSGLNLGSGGQGLSISGTSTKCTLNITSLTVTNGSTTSQGITTGTASPTINLSGAVIAGNSSTSQAITTSTGVVTINAGTNTITAGSAAGGHALNVTASGGKFIVNGGEMIDSATAVAIGGNFACWQWNPAVGDYRQSVPSSGTAKAFYSASGNAPTSSPCPGTMGIAI